MNEILLPGKYYLGDPTLVLPNKIYIGIWGELYDYANGNYDINGVQCVMHTTHKGDDTFIDNKNRKYVVTSGVLSLINVELIENINLCKNNGHVFEFVKKINFIYDAGIFYIKSGKKIITIDTRNMDEYNSDYEEHCENEEGEPISKTINHNSDNESCDEIKSIENNSDNEKNQDNENNSDNEKNEDNKDKHLFNFFKKI